MDPADEKDWRLEAELESTHGLLEELVAHMRSPSVLRALGAGLPAGVVLTHDGSRLFAYAAGREPIDQARTAISATLGERGLEAQISISHWDTELDEWRRIEPPPSAAEARAQARTRVEQSAVQTRTLVVEVGREIRGEFEQSLLNYAGELGVECKVIEHPHLLKAQVAFTVTGPRHKLDEFADGLRAEERATIRTETTVMLSPL
jgi:hypothetical protein